MKENNYYQGPGIVVYNDLQMFKNFDNKTFSNYRKLFLKSSKKINLHSNLILIIIIFILFFKNIKYLYKLLFKKIIKIPSLQNILIKVQSSNSIDNMNKLIN